MTTLIDSDWATRWAEEQKRREEFEQRGRRERIATAIIAGILANGVTERNDPEGFTAKMAVKIADRLIAELDKPPRKPRKKKGEE